MGGYNMKNRKLWVIGVAVLLCVILLTVLVANRQEDRTASVQETEVPDIAVETPYITLYYPGKWGERIRTEVKQADIVTVSFFGRNDSNQEGQLFDVIFGPEEAEILGTITTENGETCPVGVRVYDADPQVFSREEERYAFDAMQEEINYVIGQLPLENTEQYAEPKNSTVVVPLQRPAVYADILLETPYVTVAYPGELAGLLHVEQMQEEPYTLTFCWNNSETLIRLFALSFAGEEDTRVGYLKDSGIPVYMTVFDLPQNASLREEEIDTALGLQETLNDVLAKLPIQSTPVEEVPCLTYETPYGVLCYPAEYQNHLEVEVSQTDCYTLQFRFLPEDGEAIAMFDVVFGGTEGITRGQYTGADGVSVAVNLVGYAIASEELLNVQEADLYYQMAEGVNFLFDQYEVMYPAEFR